MNMIYIVQQQHKMDEFNSILTNNQNIRGKNEITKRQNKLINIEMKPQCTSLIGFHCNITPIILELNKYNYKWLEYKYKWIKL